MGSNDNTVRKLMLGRVKGTLGSPKSLLLLAAGGIQKDVDGFGAEYDLCFIDPLRKKGTWDHDQDRKVWYLLRISKKWLTP